MKWVIGFIFLSLTGFSSSAFSQHWQNRQHVLDAARHLHSEVRYFDQTLHNVNAPHHLVDDAHHLADTINTFIYNVQYGYSYSQANSAFSHIRTDFYGLQSEMYSHPELWWNASVSNEWNHIRTEMQHLEREMMYSHNRELTPEIDAGHERIREVHAEE
jgi:hypothetical protein